MEFIGLFFMGLLVVSGFNKTAGFVGICKVMNVYWEHLSRKKASLCPIVLV